MPRIFISWHDIFIRMLAGLSLVVALSIVKVTVEGKLHYENLYLWSITCFIRPERGLEVEVQTCT